MRDLMLRRFSRAITAGDLKLLCLDFLVVVAGILVGLQIDGWNKQRQERAESYETLALVNDELEKQRELFLNNSLNAKRWQQFTAYLDEVIREPERAARRPTRVLQAVLLSTYHSWHEPPITVYSNADNAGLLRHIDIRVRDALHDHYGELQYWSTIMDRLLFNHNLLDRSLAGYVTIDQHNAMDDLKEDLFGDFTLPDFGEEEAVTLARRLAADPEVMQRLPRAYWYHGAAGQLSEDFVPQIESLRALVAEELAAAK